jgi:hypothetical protein
VVHKKLQRHAATHRVANDVDCATRGGSDLGEQIRGLRNISAG